LARRRAAVVPGYSREDDFLINPLSVFDDIDSQYILILQRGVDPYSPKYVNEYNVGKLFGKSIGDPNFTFTAETRTNIPIQRLTQTNRSVQSFTQSTMFYPSHFFQAGNDFSGFTTSTVGFYGLLDGRFNTNRLNERNVGGVT
jgi:hypothetical protein